MSPHRDVMRGLGLFLLASLWASGALGAEPPTAVATAATFDRTQLAQLLQRERAATARFHELQYRRVLKQPIERRGELHFDPPALFEKRVLEPVIETYRIEGETLTIDLPKRSQRQLSLRNQPLLASLLLGFKAVIGGQLDTLDAAYEVAVAGSPAAWQLDLKPRQVEVGRYIESIRIEGEGAEPRRFEVQERSGDRTVTEIEPLAR